ncbi:polysaccharide deacetylase family protein [Streptomyces yaizuensis]|uniref:Polysaccharide deacetylase family protein n=1 Tax=Streptomyces yaizuensis TaxID=2989713 RepID=A0ABQ5NRD5_9ACTN|nr:polysaccharide deacetylase family protein [Streptomyces sp. YSPA8]GLF92895.1 polysaccharide deacetylase family protein [Streptomyces sp. YSPA8]
MPKPRAVLAALVPLLVAVGLSSPARAASWPAPAPVVSQVDTEDPVFFVTIDDGWYHDPAAARILLDRQVPASLFLLPGATSYDTVYFRRIVDNGPSRIENHGVQHQDLTTLDEQGQRAELCGARSRHLATFGQEPRLTRPPYGAFNADTRTAARACGSKAVVTWTHDQTTWGTPPPPPELRAGDIVLLHFTPDLAADLTRVLAAADAAGLKPARLRDYIRD